MKDACPIRKRGERLDPKVYAGFLSGWGQGLTWRVSARETHVPAVRFFADRDGLGRALNWARPADGDAPDLRQNQKPVVQCRAVAELLVGNGVPAVARLIAWEARFLACFHPAKECLIGLIKTRWRVLQDVAMDSRIRRKRRANV